MSVYYLESFKRSKTNLNFFLGIGMHVEIRDPDDKIILSKVYSTEGKWTFTSSAPGLLLF